MKYAPGRSPGSSIGVSGLFVRTGAVGGAEFMLYNLVRGLAAGTTTQATLFVRRTSDLDERFVRSTDALQQRGRLRIEGVGGPENRFAAEFWQVSAAARQGGLQAVLFPNYFTPPRPQPFRMVTVIHDVQYAHFPEYCSPKKRLWLQFAHRATLRCADAVVAISRFVRDDILRVYGARFESKVHVIPNPVDWSRFDATGNGRFGARTRPYVLTVASHYPHKNLDTLVRAFELARRRIPDHQLVLAGQLLERLRGVRSGGHDIRRLIRERNLSNDVVVTGHLSDDMLGRLYRDADLFVLPSRFEGFGMPAVEALGLGVPTLATRCSSLPEVTMGRATYVADPTSVGEFADAMVQMVTARRSFTPSVETVAALRARYAPQRIARMYAEVLTDDSAVALEEGRIA